ncbi:hypothetical protein [Paracoccus onubensis]|uniref:hypothetical protein n=1 Tax=Paracoccus onubensis TaxID=1675788 RepID=UPI0015FF40CD|nr:hypothetical protein [Paracoccus onubensis]
MVSLACAQSQFTRDFLVALFPISLVAISGLFRLVPMRFVGRRFAVGPQARSILELAGIIIAFPVPGLPGPIFFVPVLFLCLIVLQPLRFFPFGIIGFGLQAQLILNTIMVFRVLTLSLLLSLLPLPFRLFFLLLYRLFLGFGLLVAPQFRLFLTILFILVLRIPALLCSILIAGALLPLCGTFFCIALLLPCISLRLL